MLASAASHVSSCFSLSPPAVPRALHAHDACPAAAAPSRVSPHMKRAHTRSDVEERHKPRRNNRDICSTVQLAAQGATADAGDWMRDGHVGHRRRWVKTGIVSWHSQGTVSGEGSS